jgi:hypothetical protein
MLVIDIRYDVIYSNKEKQRGLNPRCFFVWDRKKLGYPVLIYESIGGLV